MDDKIGKNVETPPAGKWSIPCMDTLVRLQVDELTEIVVTPEEFKKKSLLLCWLAGGLLGGAKKVKRSSTVIPELLKAATMRPHGRAKVFRDCARFGFLNAKMHNLPLFHLFLGQFSIFMLVFWPFSLRKTFERKYWSRKKVRFQKVCVIHFTMQSGWD